MGACGASRTYHNQRINAMPPKQRVVNFPGVMLAHTWDGKTDITGWWMSEKLDGVRAIWNGECLVTRSAIKIHAPDWYTKRFPRDCKLDGELWMGRGSFQLVSGVVRREFETEDWEAVAYMVFDVPCHEGGLKERYSEIERATDGIDHAIPVEQRVIASQAEMFAYFDDVYKGGGEGLIVRDPNESWVPFRSRGMLKVKSSDESDAVVVGYEKGEGRNSNRVGCLLCRLNSDVDCLKPFGVGTGLSDYERENPPKIGAVIRVGHNGFTDSGVPRFPTYLGVRADCI